MASACAYICCGVCVYLINNCDVMRSGLLQVSGFGGLSLVCMVKTLVMMARVDYEMVVAHQTANPRTLHPEPENPKLKTQIPNRVPQAGRQQVGGNHVEIPLQYHWTTCYYCL